MITDNIHHKSYLLQYIYYIQIIISTIINGKWHNNDGTVINGNNNSIFIISSIGKFNCNIINHFKGYYKSLKYLYYEEYHHIKNNNVNYINFNSLKHKEKSFFSHVHMNLFYIIPIILLITIYLLNKWYYNLDDDNNEIINEETYLFHHLKDQQQQQQQHDFNNTP